MMVKVMVVMVNGDDDEGHGGDGDDNVCDDPDDSNDSFCIWNLQIDFLVPS